MFPAGELRRAQEDVLVTLPDACDLLTVARTSDGMGGWTEVWSTSRTNIPCRLDNKTGGVSMQGGAAEVYNYQVLTVPASVTIDEFTRIQIGASQYYVRNPMEGWGQIVHRYTVVEIEAVTVTP
jgi:hypothetical protein